MATVITAANLGASGVCFTLEFAQEVFFRIGTTLSLPCSFVFCSMIVCTADAAVSDHIY